MTTQASVDLASARQRVMGVIDALEGRDGYLRENWSLPPEAARFVSLLVRIQKARQVLEVGTSVGYSGLYFGLGLLETDGRLTTIDASPERQAQAKAHFEQAGLSERVECLQGDAIPMLESLKAQGRHYDLMFLDARKSEYKTYLALAESLLPQGGVLLADNTQSHRAEMADFVEAVRHSPQWDACDIETPNGMILALRR